MTRILKTALALTALALAACSARQPYPDPVPGWHNADYSVIFGRLQRVPAPDPAKPPVWILRYDFHDGDTYGGKLNILPPEKLVGYSGAEEVEVHGKLRHDIQDKDYPGTWYEISTIRIWQDHDQK